MADDFDKGAWERRWVDVLRDHGDKLAERPPNATLLDETFDLRPGLALDAGCGHGAEALRFAALGWRVTAVDFSPTVLEHARATAEALGSDLASLLEWVEGDLGSWTPAAGRFDLVYCLYVHVEGSVQEMVARLASGVAPGGTLFLLGHRPVDARTGDPTPASGQLQVSVEEARAALAPAEWDVLVAEERVRTGGLSGNDAVVRAVRRAVAG